MLCLGVVDGGSKPRTSIVIGGHQLEDNMLEFDLASSKLGFSSSLLLHNTNCSHYKIFRGCSFCSNVYVPDFSFVLFAIFLFHFSYSKVVVFYLVFYPLANETVTIYVG